MYFFIGEALAVALVGADTGMLAIILGSMGSGSSNYLISKVFCGPTFVGWFQLTKLSIASSLTSYPYF